MLKTATISPCGRYRYRLGRGNGQHKVVWCMLNPSKADANQDDPTIRKCWGFTQRLGFEAMEVCNLAAYRATDPKDLLAALKRGEDIVGPDNIQHMKELFQSAAVVIAAWGSHGDKLMSQIGHVDGLAWSFGIQTRTLGRCANGHPRHPLMVGYDAGLLALATPPRQYGRPPVEPTPAMLTEMLAGFAGLRRVPGSPLSSAG